MLKTLVLGVTTLGAWLAWHLLGELITEVLRYASGPLRRPIWRAMTNARWPWPLLAMLGLGIGTLAGSLALLTRSDWLAAVGIIGFFIGAGLTLSAPLVWRDAQREGAQRGCHPASRPVV